MTEINVLHHRVLPHQPARGEEYDPAGDMLVVYHTNPDNPDDPAEFAHHIRLGGLAYRKEMWGLSEYAEVIDAELKDLERFYFRDPQVDYGPHPLADITEHYFAAPSEHMRSFNPEYVIERMATAVPFSTDGRFAFARDVVISGLQDVRQCLSSKEHRRFPCRGMTTLSEKTIEKRSDVGRRMAEQTRRATLKSTKGLDGVRQYLTDRASELEPVREAFVNHALNEANVPGIMMERARAAVEYRAAGRL